MLNNCSSLLLLVALLSYNNHNCNSQNNCCCNSCNNCNCSGGFNNQSCTTALGMDAGMLCLLLAFLTSGCNIGNSSC